MAYSRTDPLHKHTTSRESVEALEEKGDGRSCVCPSQISTVRTRLFACCHARSTSESKLGASSYGIGESYAVSNGWKQRCTEWTYEKGGHWR